MTSKGKMAKLPFGMGEFSPKKNEPAGVTVPAGLSDVTKPHKYELRPVSKWDIFDLWRFIATGTNLNLSGMVPRGGQHAKNLKLLKQRIGSMEVLKAVGEFYGNNWKALHKHLEWDRPADAAQFYYYYDKIAYCMEHGFKKFSSKQEKRDHDHSDYHESDL